MVKYIKNEISKPLTLIMNQMLDLGIFPSGIKMSKILPIFKKGDVNSLNNYRPIFFYFLFFIVVIKHIKVCLPVIYCTPISNDLL